MSKRLSRGAACGAALSLGALAGEPAAAEGIARQFAIAPGGTLIIEAQAARLDVRGGGDGVRVIIVRGGDTAADIEEDFDISFDASATELHVSVKKRGSWPGNWRLRRHLVIEVETPEAFNVDLNTSGGNVRASQLTGTLNVRTSGGDIRFERVDGPIEAKTSGGTIRLPGTSADARLTTSGGDIIVGAVGGHVRAKTSGGRIAIEHAGGGVWAKTSGGDIAVSSAKAVEAKTSGGTIELALTGQPEEDSQLTTSGGSINVHLPSDVALDVAGSTSGGRVRLHDALAFRGDASKKSISGSLNDGGPELRMRTSGGSIRLQALR